MDCIVKGLRNGMDAAPGVVKQRVSDEPRRFVVDAMGVPAIEEVLESNKKVLGIQLSHPTP